MRRIVKKHTNSGFLELRNLNGEKSSKEKESMSNGKVKVMFINFMSYAVCIIANFIKM